MGQGSALALSILTSSRLQTALVKHDPQKQEGLERKKLPESPVIYRSVKSELNERVKKVALDCIVTVCAHWRIDLAQLF